jgi:hypothetical protein
MRYLRDWRVVVGLAAAGWGGALAYSTASARVLYGDGALYVLIHLITPFRFNDYDFQRSFASYMSQAPMLLGQRLGLESVAGYAALYSVGIFVLPAALLLTALFLARRQPMLFAAVAAAIVVYGFGLNFINSEANVLFGLVWLCASILALDRPAPILRGIVLPLAAVALLRTYEGMLLAGLVLALWAVIAAGHARAECDRVGLMLSGVLFLLGAAIGLGGFLSPRDPNNAASFLASSFHYLRNPQVFLLLSALLVLPAIGTRNRSVRIACGIASAACGAAFVFATGRLTGYYGFDVYYHNRSFLVLMLPAFVGAVFVVHATRPHWLAAGSPDAFAIILVPLGFAIAGDAVGTSRWNAFMETFCSVLEADRSPAERLAMLQKASVRTAWPWTHPTMSVLLRDRGSRAMVTNEPGNFEPFDASNPPSIDNRGICQVPMVGASRPDTFGLPMAMASGKYPSYVSRVSGLGAPEGWATWSEGPEASIEFARPLPRSFDLAVRLGSAFGSNRTLPIRVRAGSVEKSFLVDRDTFETTLEFRDVGDAAKITFLIPRPESPRERGSGDDPRKLGIAFVSLAVMPRDGTMGRK